MGIFVEARQPPRSVKMKFSVIIPLEFNRGLAVRCIRDWVRDQTFPRADYEILVAASETHDPEELKTIGELLGPQDTLVQFPVSHDMGLVASVAKLAAGDVLVITESHCPPAPNFLEASVAVLKEHAEWGGFSGRSFALTHNLLSIVEAEFFEEGIIANLTQHAWLKVLDQCFVIRAADYRTTGGIEPAYGHFAEWHFAGRLHLCGIKIGYAPEVNVGHYYVGDLAELKTFILDFTEGEMRCVANADTDPCGPLFEPSPEWKCRARWDRGLIDPLWRLLRSRARTSWRTFFKYGTWRIFSLGAAISVTRVVLGAQQGLLNALLLVRWKRGAKVLFQRWSMTCVRLARLMFLRDALRNRGDSALADIRLPDEWMPAAAAGWDAVGFHELESSGGLPFRWTESAGCMRFYLGEGVWTVTLELLPDTPDKLIAAAEFFIAGQPCRVRRVNASAKKSVELEWNQPRAGSVELAWLCKRVRARRDPRELGLPILKIQWQARTGVGVVAGAACGVARAEASA